MILKEFYDTFSVKILKEMHESPGRDYEHDRNLTQQQKDAALNFRCPLAYYGTDVEKDWPEHVDAIEEALSAKNVTFIPIVK
ncbi:hypothetical protein [Serratia proteamaculans]|uniref:hypothetical protein n=1 Tax=Serratia proteamaculans TaxID=28151 RepID=UPI0024B93EF4|nr:hypothetical protein [Serratia proteamaculans]